MLCKDCYGKCVIHQINGFTGISTFKPCKCTKPKQKSQWRLNLIKNLAEYNQMNEEQVKEYIGVTT